MGEVATLEAIRPLETLPFPVPDELGWEHETATREGLAPDGVPHLRQSSREGRVLAVVSGVQFAVELDLPPVS